MSMVFQQFRANTIRLHLPGNPFWGEKYLTLVSKDLSNEFGLTP